jgi:hypothetical protein
VDRRRIGIFVAFFKRLDTLGAPEALAESASIALAHLWERGKVRVGREP